MNAEAHYKLSQTARQLHLPDEQKQQLKLFLDIRATRDKIRDLYREMNPGQPAPTSSTPATTPHLHPHPLDQGLPAGYFNTLLLLTDSPPSLALTSRWLCP